MARNQTPLTDTPAYKLTNAIYRWFAVSMLWLLCSLPVITIGAATAAAMGEFSDPENYYGHKLVKDFFCRFGRCFLRATGLWLLLAALAGLLVLDITFYQQLTGSSGRILPVLAVILGNLLVGFFRFGCYVAATDGEIRLGVLLKKAGKTMLLCLPIWAAMVGVDLAVVTTMIQVPYLMIVLILLPGLFADIHCKLIRMFLRRYEPEQA